MTHKLTRKRKAEIAEEVAGYAEYRADLEESEGTKAEYVECARLWRIAAAAVRKAAGK